MSSKKKVAAQPLPSLDLAQLGNVTGGCGGGHRRQQQQQVNNYYYNPYDQQQYGGYGGYGGAPYDVQTYVDYGQGQQQVVNNGGYYGGYGIPTSGNSYNR
jgi:hypothetical protein